MGRKKAKPKLDHPNVKFVELHSRKFIMCKVDLTKGRRPKTFSLEKYIESPVEGSIFKARIKYKKGEEHKAYEVYDKMIEQVKGQVKHVYKPDFIAVGSASVRMPEMNIDISPVEAVDQWLAVKQPATFEVEEVRNVFLQCMKDVGLKDGLLFSKTRANPTPFYVREVSCKNFMLYKGEHEISIPQGMIGIRGIYDDNESKSNKSGKSTLIDLMAFVLGIDSRGFRTNNEYIHGSEDEMVARICLVDEDGSELDIVRKMSASGLSKLVINGDKYKKAEGGELIEEWLGMSREDCANTCFSIQGKLHGVLAKTSSVIKDYMMGWLGLENWNVINSHISKQLSEKVTSLRKMEAMQEVQLEIVAEDKPSTMKIRNAELKYERMKKIKDGSENVQLKIENLENEKSNVEQYLSSVVPKGREKEVEGEMKELVKTKETELKAMAGLESKLGGLKGEATDCSRLIDKGFSGRCPVDDGKCDRKDEINDNMEKQEKLLEKIHKKIVSTKNALEKSRSRLRKQKDKIDDLSPVLTKIQNDCKLIAAYEKADKTITPGNAKGRLKSVVKRLEDFNKSLSKFGVDQDDLDNAKDLFVELFAKHKQWDDADKKVKQYRNVIVAITQEVQLLRYLKYMTGKKGIPSMQIENSLITVESQVNSILEMMGTDHRLEFSFETELKRKASVCYECGYIFEGSEKECPECQEPRGKERSDELSIHVLDTGKVQSFEQNSGGGKDLLALAVRIALARFLGSKVLFFDETCGTLDEDTELGFKQVFMISHRPEVAEALPKNIFVTRHSVEGWSEFGWE